MVEPVPARRSPAPRRVRCRAARHNSSLDAAACSSPPTARARHQFGISSRDIGRPLQDLEVSYRPGGAAQRASTARVAERREVALKDVHCDSSAGETRYFDVVVAPLFDEQRGIIGIPHRVRGRHPFRLLQSELHASKQELETAYEELQSTNEELETTNEELQSTVEELETTNEELQSTNEELETMNEELQSTNEELQTMNDEMRSRSDRRRHDQHVSRIGLQQPAPCGRRARCRLSGQGVEPGRQGAVGRRERRGRRRELSGAGYRAAGRRAAAADSGSVERNRAGRRRDTAGNESPRAKHSVPGASDRAALGGTQANHAA